MNSGHDIDAFFDHVHNDYVSGGRELAALGAQVVAPSDSGLAFPHHAVRDGDTLPFVFNTGPDTAIENTFAYDRDRDVWTWAIDNVRGGQHREFARVTLTRK